MKNNTETSSHSILDTRFAKLVIGKSYLGILLDQFVFVSFMG